MTPNTPVTTAAAEAASPAQGRFASILLLGAGTALLVVLAFWVTATQRAAPGLGEGAETFPHIAWLGPAASFTPHTSLPPARQEEIRKLYDEANQLVSTYAARSRSAAQWGQYTDWLAFGLSSLIMMLAGYFGRLPESGSDATAAAHALQAQEGSKKKGRSRGPRAVSSRRGFAVLVGIVAALAATSTGTSNRLQASATQSLASAKVISEALVKASKVATAPTSDADLEEALQNLRQALLLTAP